MSRDLSKLALYAIVNYTAVGGDAAAAVTIPVAGITTNNAKNFILLWKVINAIGGAAGAPTTAVLANGGITFQSSNANDLSTYQFTIYQQE